jgi:hypothetical protein
MNGIKNGKGGLNIEEKQAFIEWERNFDVKYDNSMTLVENSDIKIWLSWGIWPNINANS